MEVPKFTGTSLTFTRSDRYGACYLQEYCDIWKVVIFGKLMVFCLVVDFPIITSIELFSFQD